MSAITISLLHPTQPIAMHSWTFESDRHEPIRIGRSYDNEIVVYSAVVSRYHAELWPGELGWSLKGFGANGTFVNEQMITEELAIDGMIFRLGSSGPRLQIRLGMVDTQAKTIQKGDPKVRREPNETEKQSTFITSFQWQNRDEWDDD